MEFIEFLEFLTSIRVFNEINYYICIQIKSVRKWET